jgi:hypothetical protein
LLPRWVFRGGGDGAGLAGEAAARQGAAGEGRAGSRRRAAAARLRRLAPLLGCLRLRARGAAQEALGRRGVHRRRSLRGGRGGVRPVRREMGTTTIDCEFPRSLKNSATMFQAVVMQLATTDPIDGPTRPPIGTSSTTTRSSGLALTEIRTMKLEE